MLYCVVSTLCVFINMCVCVCVWILCLFVLECMYGKCVCVVYKCVLFLC